MNRYTSKELAFYNILETTFNLSLADEKTNFKISLKELADITELPKKDIIENIDHLCEIDLIQIIEQNNEDYIILDITNTDTRVKEIFSIEEIEHILKEFDYFVNRYETLLVKNDIIKKYSKITKEKLELGTIDTSFNSLIGVGVSEIFTKNEIVKLEMKIYNLSEEIDEKDMKIMEVVLFCLYNFKVTENPFLVTLFLASIQKHLK